MILYERTLASEARHLVSLGDTKQEEQIIAEALTIAQKTNDQLGYLILLQRHSSSLRRAQNLPVAEAAGQQALDLSEKLGARQLKIDCLLTLGSIARDGNHLQEAKIIFERGLTLAHELGTPRLAGLKLNLANVENNLGYPARARKLYLEALESAKQVGDRGLQNVLNGNLGIMDYMQGNLDEGMQRLQ